MKKQAFGIFVIVLQAIVAGAIIMQLCCVSFSPSATEAAQKRQCIRTAVNINDC